MQLFSNRVEFKAPLGHPGQSGSFLKRVLKARLPSMSHMFVVSCAVLLSFAIALPLATTSADAKKRKSKRTETVIAKPEGPLTIVISLGRQRIGVFDGSKRIANAPISSGSRGRRTPTGIFSVLQKNRRHFSNLYNSAPMPNMQRITWSGIAMHAGNLPGYPASHGCIRLPYSFSKRLFGVTKLGTRVVVAKGSPQPSLIEHANLLKPLRAGALADVPSPVPASKPEKRSSSAAEMLLGVTPAHAAVETDPSVPSRPTGTNLTRASLAAYRQQELVYLKRNADEIMVERKAAAVALKAANVEVRQAQKLLSAAKAAGAKLTKTISQASRDSIAASRKMQVFGARSGGVETPLELQKAQEREAALEADMMASDSEREMAIKEASDLRSVISGHAKTLAAKVATRKQLARKSGEVSKRHSAALKALNVATQADKRRERPITVLVSRKTMKIHVRQGYDPVFSAPIEIDNPEAPLGTHFFSAYSYTSDGDDLVWHGVVADRDDVKRSKRKRRKSRRRARDDADVVVARAGRPAQTPMNALNRIKMSDEVRERLAELVKPGSAMFISDEGVSNETGKYTEIIVRTY